jgi:hypothetical protein
VYTMSVIKKVKSIVLGDFENITVNNTGNKE